MGFSKFNERLLSLNHLFKYLNMIIMSLTKSVGLELVTIILVPSANRTGLDLSLTKSGMPLMDLVWILVEHHTLFYPILKLFGDKFMFLISTL
jgi:hypothetical protein